MMKVRIIAKHLHKSKMQVCKNAKIANDKTRLRYAYSRVHFWYYVIQRNKDNFFPCII